MSAPRGREVTPRELVVVKLGSSVLDGPDGFAAAAAEVARHVDGRWRVVAVVSAMGRTTETLLEAATAVAGTPDEGELARLLSKGEETSACLLSLALRACDVDAEPLDVAELGLRTTGPLLDAEPLAADLGELRARLERARVVVVPGFAGIDVGGARSLLGRGGSDYTALFLAHALGAAGCRLVKDVAGLYASDPAAEPRRPSSTDRARWPRRGTGDGPGRGSEGAARPRAAPVPLPAATWGQLLRLGGGLVQPRAVRFAERRGLDFVVAGLGSEGTRIGAPRPPGGVCPRRTVGAGVA